MNPRDVGLSREVVSEWFEEYRESHDGEEDTPDARRTFFSVKLREMDLMVPVNTTGNDSLGDSTELVDLILEDLPSYE